MKEKNTSILKTCLIFLTVILLLGTILLSFNYAMSTGRDFPNSISYSMGSLIFVCIIVAIFSAIKSTKKHLVYIAFFITLLSFIGRLNFNIQQTNVVKLESLQQQHMNNEENINHTSFHSKEYSFTCTFPEGFLPARSSKSSEIAMYVYPNYTNYEKMLIIEVGKPRLPDSSSIAKSLAEDWNGEVLPNHVKLGGTDALQVKAGNEVVGLKAPTDAIVAMKNGVMFLIMAGSNSDQSCEAEINTILESWKWTDNDKL